MEFKYQLTSYYRERDRSGQVYRSFTFTDLETQKEISFDMGGQVSDTNIYAIKYYWQMPYGWHSDCPILYIEEGMKPREYDRFTKGWERTSKTRNELVSLIKERLEINR